MPPAVPYGRVERFHAKDTGGNGLPTQQPVMPTQQPLLPIQQPLLPIQQPVLPIQQPVEQVQELGKRKLDDDKTRLENRLLDLQCDKLAIELKRQKTDVAKLEIDTVMKFQAAMISLHSPWHPDQDLVAQTQDALKRGFYIYMYTYIYIWIYVYICVCIYIYIYIYISIYMYICICMYS